MRMNTDRKWLMDRADREDRHYVSIGMQGGSMRLTEWKHNHKPLLDVGAKIVEEKSDCPACRIAWLETELAASKRETTNTFAALDSELTKARAESAAGGMTCEEARAKTSSGPALPLKDWFVAGWQACAASQQAEIDAVVGEFAKLMNALEPELTGPPKNVRKASWAAQWDAAEAICQAHGWRG